MLIACGQQYLDACISYMIDMIASAMLQTICFVLCCCLRSILDCKVAATMRLETGVLMRQQSGPFELAGTTYATDQLIAQSMVDYACYASGNARLRTCACSADTFIVVSVEQTAAEVCTPIVYMFVANEWPSLLTSSGPYLPVPYHKLAHHS